jgi:putative Holliday junction resolvase
MKTYNLLENDKFVEIINKQSRLIGIDHGKKNIGISICDENHNIATPLTTIEFTQLKFFIIEIRNIIKENNIEGIVFLLHFGMKDSPVKALIKVCQNYRLM